MILYRRIGLESPTEWRKALAGIPHGFNHTWESAYASFLNDGVQQRLHIVETDRGRVVCPFIEREVAGWRDLATPPGFSGFVGAGPVDDFAELWPKLAADAGFACGYVVLDPIWSEPTYHREADATHYNDVYLLDLSVSEAELRGRLDQNRRRELASWDKVEAAQSVADRAELIDFLVTEYPVLVARAGLPASYRMSEASIRYLCSLPNVLLVGARVDAAVVAVVVFPFTDSVGQVQFIVSTLAGRNRSSALVWKGLRRLKERGIPLLNLGGGSRPGDSVAAAKERFRGRKTPLRCVRQIYDRESFAAACRWASVESTSDDFFPPYRRPGWKPAIPFAHAG